MPAFKYMSAEGGLRFLGSWSLRLTPPADFNDPFELRPPVPALFTQAYLEKGFAESAPGMVIDGLAKALAPRFQGQLTAGEIRQMASSVFKPLPKQAQHDLFKHVCRKVPGCTMAILTQMQRRVQLQLPSLMEQARADIANHLPAINAIVRTGFSEDLPARLGVLCLSRNGRQALMWSHYADSHRGMMVEFDTSHPTFNRRRSNEGDMGYLRPVTYSRVRPKLEMEVIEGDTAFEVFALTKADQWSYEEEERLIWPLERSDQTVTTPGGVVHLLDCPPAAIVSVTLGCKAADETLALLKVALRDRTDASHVQIRRARLDDIAFELVYEPV